MYSLRTRDFILKGRKGGGDVVDNGDIADRQREG